MASPASGEKTAVQQPSLVVTPNEFEGTDVERINRAIEVATESGRRTVIPHFNIRGTERRDVWLIDSAILLRSNTTLKLDNSRIRLSDRCRDNLMRSVNRGLGIAHIRPMENIHIRGISPLGDTRRVIINNVISRAEHTIRIGGSLCDAIIHNVVRYDRGGEAVTIASGPNMCAMCD